MKRSERPLEEAIALEGLTGIAVPVPISRDLNRVHLMLASFLMGCETQFESDASGSLASGHSDEAVGAKVSQQPGQAASSIPVERVREPQNGEGDTAALSPVSDELPSIPKFLDRRLQTGVSA